MNDKVPKYIYWQMVLSEKKFTRWNYEKQFEICKIISDIYDLKLKRICLSIINFYVKKVKQMKRR